MVGPAEVCEGVFIGSRADAGSKAALKARAITAVLHLVDGPYHEPEKHVVHKTICLEDQGGE